ncbi:MAG: BatD family protein [Marinobacter sp.]|uniref:BatD family protein n=1 Tax=Marinobacter sp. TaxID=50741 RepID=UPI00299F19B6|nr:BatD family protein [Marinobacter sp.]MDX1636044.1 BatD family protein [Marinobacter sp.]
MVSRFAKLLSLLFLAVLPAIAGAELKVEPDRTTLYENETLTLTVTGDMELSVNFDILFNLGNLELPAPDIEKLEQDFEILARNQKYSIRTVNGETRALITWTYQLEPLRTGKLTIPALNFNNATSEPVTVTVMEGRTPATASGPRDAYIELSADKDDVYVQEQMILTVRLFFAGNLIRGELSEPQHPDAIIESLGSQKEYNRFIDGRRFRVVERRYAIYPQQPGELVLDPIRFEGQTRDSEGQLQFVRDRAQLFDVPVKPVPAQFTGQTWLPASSLTLSDSGIPQQDRLTVGESLTRTITLKAEGLQAEALPPLTLATPDGIKSYPEAPQTSTDISNETVTGTLTQTAAIVGVEPGPVTLPPITLAWWDTKADQQREAVIPARTLTVVGVNGATTPTPPAAAPEPEAEASPEPDEPVTASGGAGFWPWLAGALALGWLLTVVWLRRGAGQSKTEAGPSAGEMREKALFEDLCRCARAGDVRTLDLLPRWLTAAKPGQTFRTVSEVVNWAEQPELKAELDRLQACRYGQAAARDGGWQGDRLVKLMENLRKHPSAPADSGDLPPLYPRALRS